jgi:hypothetical protein
MTNFTEDDHPRTTTGAFTDKAQSEPEAEISAFIVGDDENNSPWDLSEGDMLIYSHAEGDFDGADLGIEGIEVWRDERKVLHAAAYTDLDFYNLAPSRDASGLAWLDEKKADIYLAVASSYGYVSLDDANGDWETQKVVIGLSPSTGTFPGGHDGVVQMATDSPHLARLLGDLITETNDQPFWAKVRGQLAEITADREQELAGIRKLGRQGRI